MRHSPAASWCVRSPCVVLVSTMRTVGERFARDEGSRVGLTNVEVIQGFHRIPLRSVDYLHMHCLCPPFRAFQKLRFVEVHKTIFGFISVESVLRNLTWKH
mmetsp:Transcript_4617/g.9249  ORF Transcript_4617/g.9249 Transcript_4617/m.9249 type:complete len:101 (-) Transcript_4617:5343-5645(-)